MTFFKTSRLTLSVFSAVIAITGCFKPGSHQAGDSTATFYLEEVKGSSQITTASEQWNLPTARTYSFSVPVKDAHSMESIKDHAFIISDAAGNVLVPSVRTNADGNLTWSEVIRYNYLSDAKYIPLTRIITANGVHTGKRTAQIAINPWYERHRKNTLKDVIDLTRVQIDADQMVPESESLLYLNGAKKSVTQKRRLYIDGMIVQMSQAGPNASKANVTIKLDMTPQMLLHDINNNPEGIGLQKAKFRIQTSLISKISEGDPTTKKDVIHRYLLGTAESSEPQQMLGDRVRFDVPFYQVFASSIGQLEMAIKLIPIEGPTDLEPFEGVFLVGNYNQNTGFTGYVPKLTTIKDDYKFHIKDFIKDNVIDLKTLGPGKLPSGVFAVKPYMFSFINPTFSEVEIKYETPTSRVTDIRFQTTVTNPMDGHRPVAFVKFKIKGIDGVEKEAETNQQGILFWTDRLPFKTYKFRHYFSRDVTFTVPSTGWNETFTVRVNPWAQFGYALGMDNRQIDEKAQHYLLSEDDVIPSTAYMGKLVLAFNENPIYNVKDDLSIEPYKSFILNLAPKVIAPTDPLTGSDKVDPFRDGYYLLKLAVVSVIEGQKYVTTFKKLANVRDSQINEPVRLVFPDIRQMRVRNLLYIEFHPVDYKKLTPALIMTKGRAPFGPNGEITQTVNLDDLIEKDSGLDQRTFVGVFTPFAPKSEGPLRPTDDLDEIFDLTNQLASYIAPKSLQAMLGLKLKNEKPTERQSRFLGGNDMYAVDSIKMDNMDQALHGFPAFLKMSQDARFQPGFKFPDSASVLRFITKSHNDFLRPITVADLEQEEKVLNKQHDDVSKTKTRKDAFLKVANAELVQLNNLNATLKNLPEIKNNNKIVNPNADSFVNALNKFNDADPFFTGNRLYPDNDKIKRGGFIDKFAFGKTKPEDYYFEFSRQELEKLLPVVNEPMGTEYKNHINSIIMKYSNHFEKGGVDIAFNFPQYQVKTGVKIDKMPATRLCAFWFNQMYAPLGHFELAEPLTRACIDKVMSVEAAGQSIENIFVLDQKIKVLERGPYVMDHGYFTRLNLGSAVRVNFGHSISESSSYSFTPLKALPFMPDFINSSFGWTFFQHNEGHDMNESKSADQSAGTTISTEQARFYMVINSYERCSVIRMNPNYIVELNLPERFGILNNDNAQKLLDRGIMICTGKEEHTPFLVPESFYYMTPDPFDGSLLEISDPRSYDWVIGFRGARDYTQFFNMLRRNGVKTYGENGRNKYDELMKFKDIEIRAETQRAIDADKAPAAYIELGIKDFKNSTGGVLTTYPGIYTVP